MKNPTIDTWYQYPVVEQKIGRKISYGVKFQGGVLPLLVNPRKKFVEISARELLRCFSRH